MRAHSRTQLGATNWAFIIALLLLLVFIYLWYDETDKIENLTRERDDAVARAQALNDEAVVIANLAEDISKAVGWRNKVYVFDKVSNPGSPSITVTDAAAVRANSSPDGVVTVGEETRDGLLKQIIAEAQLAFDRKARRHTTTIGEAKPYKFETLGADFKQKLDDVVSKYAELPSRPIPPADPDDAQGQARYKAELQAYEARVAEYHAALKELTGMEGYKEFEGVIREPGTWGEISTELVKVHYFKYAAEGGERTLQAAVENIPQAFRNMKAELAAYIDAANALISQLESDKRAKEEALAQAQQTLLTEQEGRTNDVTQLQNQLNEANEGRNRNMIEKTEAEQNLAREKDDRVKVETTLKREIEARKEQNRLLKEKRDLIIARDDPDGTVLASNSILHTATIDLGTADKVYVGQKFIVSALDRGGNRVNKGEIMIVRVSGRHASQVRVLSGSVGDGDRIHNPFFQVGERVYIYIAGKLDKWPKEMAKQRLGMMNAVVQDEMNGDTHYVVVPNSWAAPAEKAAGEGDDDDDDEGAANPLEEIQKKARIFGANVITERLLDAFLDY